VSKSVWKKRLVVSSYAQAHSHKTNADGWQRWWAQRVGSGVQSIVIISVIGLIYRQGL
jgi:hypothetical protein